MTCNADKLVLVTVVENRAYREAMGCAGNSQCHRGVGRAGHAKSADGRAPIPGVVFDPFNSRVSVLKLLDTAGVLEQVSAALAHVY